MNLKQNLIQFIPPIFLKINRKLRGNKSNVISKYKIGELELDIPPNYCLPRFQAEYKLYDRFLPVLAKHLATNQAIIDVGANIGDTAINIAQFCENPIICIEPSNIFFPYLERNIELINSKSSGRIKTINAIVGTSVFSGEIVHSPHGTASLKIGEKSEKSSHIPLDSLVQEPANVSLLKVDTDGFDFDVIRSAEKILVNSEPILFWENQMVEDYQVDGFEELYNLLSKIGYKYLYIFDNYGNLIFEESNFETLKTLNAYIYSMDKYGCTRSLFYTDILATTEKHHLVAKAAIKEFKEEWIKK